MENNKIDIVVLSRSNQFINFLDENFKDDSINLISSVKNIQELESYIWLKRNILVIVYIRDVDFNCVDKFIDYTESKNLYFCSVCEDANVGFEMIKRGALNTIIYVDSQNTFEKQRFLRAFSIKIKDAYKIKSMMNKRELNTDVKVNSNKIIVIGSSTGGTEALIKIFKKLPQEVPPILIVQHIPPVFSRMYAERLNELCKFTVWEAKNGDKLKSGLALIAPGGYQMKLVRKIDGLAVECFKSEKVNGVAPSVDVLFESVAEIMGNNVIGVILTGMGNDGAKGLLEIRKNGGFTIGQDEKSCVVYGMPRVAFEIGAVKKQVDLESIANYIMGNL